MSNNDLYCSRCQSYHHPADVCAADGVMEEDVIAEKDSEIARLKQEIRVKDAKIDDFHDRCQKIEDRHEIEIDALKEELGWWHGLIEKHFGGFGKDQKYKSLRNFVECILNDNSRLKSMVDGASVIVELWKAESPAQIEWKKSWLERAKEAVE